MEYKPGLPDRNSNVSHEHPLREFAVLLVGAVAVFLGLVFALGLFVDRAVDYIDPELEAELFSAFGSESSEAQSEREVALQSLMDQLGECIDVGYPVRLSIDPTPEINAFALPGGKVVVLEGLLDAVQSENGLAFVLAHELGHFKNRDHLRGMGRSLVLLAVSVAFTGAHSDLSSLLTPVSYAEGAQYSQSRESLADEVALDALNCHYGHVGGATEFFETLADPDVADEWDLAHYFSSHPEARERIEQMQALARERGYRVAATKAAVSG